MEGNYVNRNSTHREDHGFSFEEHHPWGTSSWPARNYACSFCKREFKSAQALGGHMNVHRRDRARLRSSLLSSWVNNSSDFAKPNPNPNPNFKPNNNQTLVLSSPPSSSSPSPNLSDEILNCAHLSPLYNSPCLTLSSSTSGDKKPRLTTSPRLLIPLVSTPQSMDHVNYMSMNHTRSAFIGVGDDDKELKCCDEHNKVLKSNEHNITLELGIGLLKHQEEKLDLELRLGH